jgi:hypothetical protein
MDSERGSNSIPTLLSIIFGIVVGVLLYSIYKPPVLLHGPNSRDIVDKIFSYKGKTFRLDPKVCACPRFSKRTK